MKAFMARVYVVATAYPRGGGNYAPTVEQKLLVINNQINPSTQEQAGRQNTSETNSAGYICGKSEAQDVSLFTLRPFDALRIEP